MANQRESGHQRGGCFARKAIVASLACALALAGCSRGLDEKIDAKDRASYSDSIQSIQKNMDDGERAQFAAALREVEWGAAQPSMDSPASARGPRVAWVSQDAFEQAALRAVDGKTGRQIVADAQARAQSRQKGLGAQIDAQIGRLQKDRDDRQKQQAVLSQIKTQNGLWSWDDSLGYGRLALSLRIDNQSSVALSAVDLAPGELASEEAGGDDSSARAADGNRGWRVDLAPPLPSGQSRVVALEINPYAASQILTPAQQSQIQTRKTQPQALRALNALGPAGVKLAPDFGPEEQSRLASLLAARERQKNLDADLAKALDSK